MSIAAHPARSPLASVNVQQLLDFLEHMPERFTPVVQNDPDCPFSYYVTNSCVDDALRAKVLVIPPEFAVTLRALANTFLPIAGEAA
jgi:hypothetical protein